MPRKVVKEIAGRLRAIADEAETGTIGDLSLSELEAIIDGAPVIGEKQMKRSDWDKLPADARRRVLVEDHMEVID